VFLHLSQPGHLTPMVLRHDRTIPLAPKSYQRTPWRCCHASFFARSLRMVANLEFEILNFLTASDQERRRAPKGNSHYQPVNYGWIPHNAGFGFLGKA
jgi:hypothetical protein